MRKFTWRNGVVVRVLGCCESGPCSIPTMDVLYFKNKNKISKLNLTSSPRVDEAESVGYDF